jgi:hypothetical protein
MGLMFHTMKHKKLNYLNYKFVLENNLLGKEKVSPYRQTTLLILKI